MAYIVGRGSSPTFPFFLMVDTGHLIFAGSGIVPDPGEAGVKPAVMVESPSPPLLHWCRYPSGGKCHIAAYCMLWQVVFQVWINRGAIKPSVIKGALTYGVVQSMGQVNNLTLVDRGSST